MTMSVDVMLSAVLGVTLELIGRAVASVVGAWRHVTIEAITNARPRRAVACLLHIFAAVPLVIGTFALGRYAAVALTDDMFLFVALLVLLPVAAFVLIAAAFLIAGSLVGAAGALTGDVAHRGAGVAAAIAGVILGLSLLDMGQLTFGWPVTALSVLALAAEALLWATPED